MIAITHNKRDKPVLLAKEKACRGSLKSQKYQTFKRTIWIVRGHSWIVRGKRIVNTMVLTGQEILDDYHKPLIVAFRQGNTIVPRSEWEKGKLDSRYMIRALYSMPPESETFQGIMRDYYDNFLARFIWDARQIEYIQGVDKWEPRLSRHVRRQLDMWVGKWEENFRRDSDRVTIIETSSTF